jgi:hypothetical protein
VEDLISYELIRKKDRNAFVILRVLRFRPWFIRRKESQQYINFTPFSYPGTHLCSDDHEQSLCFQAETLKGKATLTRANLLGFRASSSFQAALNPWLGLLPCQREATPMGAGHEKAMQNSGYGDACCGKNQALWSWMQVSGLKRENCFRALK